ncbi:Alpha/beta hydrolase fold-3 [Penicillium bovifimosum]|uniref:Alpha/beta hydrolase fold-3 n=1 Tax=Penicillium bovifimosum TaxID=126998 RepID=A0A9W9GHE4_9EURO|nr:Alpha/beta hydrolase fold-3 [Penicillium bovifimosum]KAJ5120280.1 Alpha/beta hydrolase fold-3 [Penicillium bovifimosum]
MLSAPFAPFLYLHPRFRQVREWSYRQALTTTFVKVFLRVFIFFRTRPPLSLRPGLDRDRFVQIEPAASELYSGITIDDEIQPVTVGGTWFPTLYQYTTTTEEDKHVIIHFHGGSYILGDGRTSTCHSLAKNLLKHTPSSHVFSLQYRLACKPNGRFPAQLQDAISAYSYLLHTLHIPASRIVLSGDSAGGHLVLALLRYISDYDDEQALPSPTCSWVFSPWCDIPGALNNHLWDNIPNALIDYIPPSFPAWGAKHVIGNLEITEDYEPYLAPIWHPFPLPSPLLIVSGGKEVMCQEHDRMTRHLSKMQQNEDRVEYFVQDLAPHDIIMVAWLLGFHEEAEQCAIKAGIY